MGVTIAYRGQLADLSRVEDFEDRLVDLALEMGGRQRSGEPGPTTIRSAWSAASSWISRRGTNRPVCCFLPRDG